MAATRRDETRRKKKLSLITLLLLRCLILAKPKLLTERTVYMRDLNQDRFEIGEFHRLVENLRKRDLERYTSYFRMSPESFDKLLNLVRPRLEHLPNHRYPISAEMRLAMTLMVLATGASQMDAATIYCIGESTACLIIKETTVAIWAALRTQYMPLPTADTRKVSAEDFGRLWNFPHCCGAIDGKHVRINAPANSGSEYRNYKGTFSVVLMAVVDAHYRFVAVDVGGYGRQSDGGTFEEWEFGQAVNTGIVNLPPQEPLLGSQIMAPYVFLADDAFPLGTSLMKPFGGDKRTDAQRIYDYRLSRARRTVENAFGIMANRWRIFHKTICYGPEMVTNITKACVVLHNFLREETMGDNGGNEYIPLGYIDHERSDKSVVPGTWHVEQARTGNIFDLEKPAYRRRVNAIRDHFVEYFVSEAGSVSRQNRFALGQEDAAH